MKKKSFLILTVVSLIIIVAVSFIVPDFRNNIESNLANIPNPKSIYNKLSKLNDVNVNAASKEIDNIKFELIPQTPEKRIFLLTGNKNPTIEEIEEANKIICYELRITHKEGEEILKLPNQRSFEERVMYFTSEMEKNIKLIVEDDTLSCGLFHFERNFGFAPYQSIHLGFQNLNNWQNKPHHIIIEDEYFNFGQIHLESTY
jgi:hypothetical protein